MVGHSVYEEERTKRISASAPFGVTQPSSIAGQAERSTAPIRIHKQLCRFSRRDGIGLTVRDEKLTHLIRGINRLTRVNIADRHSVLLLAENCPDTAFGLSFVEPILFAYGYLRCWAV